MLSPMNLAIRYRVETAVKFSPHPGFETGGAKTFQLIALSHQIRTLDGFMDSLYHLAVVHELRIDQSLQTTIEPGARVERAVEQWKIDTRPHTFRKQREDLLNANQELINPVQESEITDSNFWSLLDGPIEEELGYSLTDRMRFVQGLIKLFEPKERLKIIKENALIEVMGKASKLPENKIRHLINDLCLSPETFENVTVKEMFPS